MMDGLEVTNNVSAPLLLALGTAVGTAGKMLLDAWKSKGRQAVAHARLEQVEAPVANAQAWAQVFEVSQRLTLSLQADLARLEQRINDQDDEHRNELAERDRRYAELASLQRETAGSLRRLRSYVVIVTNLLNEHGIAFPSMPDEDVEPERRTPTVTAEVVIHPKERK